MSSGRQPVSVDSSDGRSHHGRSSSKKVRSIKLFIDTVGVCRNGYLRILKGWLVFITVVFYV